MKRRTYAELREAKLFQTDLRGANLTGWSLCRHDLKGTIITPRQVEDLARELDIQIV